MPIPFSAVYANVIYGVEERILTYLTYGRIPLKNLALSVTFLCQSSLSDALRSAVARG